MVRSEGVRRIVTAIHIVAVLQFVAVLCLLIHEKLIAFMPAGEMIQNLVWSLVFGLVLAGVAWIIKGFNTPRQAQFK